MNDTEFVMNNDIKKEEEDTSMDNTLDDSMNNSIDHSFDNMDDSKLMLEWKEETGSHEKVVKEQYPMLKLALEADASLPNFYNDYANNSKETKKPRKRKGRPLNVKKANMPAKKRTNASRNPRPNKKAKTVSTCSKEVTISLKRIDSDVNNKDDDYLYEDEIISDEDDEVNDVDNENDEDYIPEKDVGFLPNEKHAKHIKNTKDLRKRKDGLKGIKKKKSNKRVGSLENSHGEKAGDLEDSEEKVEVKADSVGFEEENEDDFRQEEDEDSAFKRSYVCV